MWYITTQPTPTMNTNGGALGRSYFSYRTQDIDSLFLSNHLFQGGDLYWISKKFLEIHSFFNNLCLYTYIGEFSRNIPNPRFENTGLQSKCGVDMQERRLLRCRAAETRNRPDPAEQKSGTVSFPRPYPMATWRRVGPICSHGTVVRYRRGFCIPDMRHRSGPVVRHRSLSRITIMRDRESISTQLAGRSSVPRHSSAGTHQHEQHCVLD